MEKREVCFAERDCGFCPVGTAAFDPPHIPSRSPSGVMIEFPVLELYLAARLVYLLGLITAPAKGKGVSGCGGQ